MQDMDGNGSRDGLTRRTFIAGAGSLLLLGAAGCGGSGEESSSTGERTVAHDLGRTSVPGEPSRLLVLDLSLLDMTLSLGVEPAGASPIFPTEREPGPFVSYLGDGARNVEPVGDPGAPNLETVAGFGPDLIIGSSFLMEDVYDQLSEIAPTVAFDTFDSVKWKEETFPLLGETLNREDEVRDVLSHYEARVERLRSEAEDPSVIEVSSVSVYDDGLAVNGTAYPGGVILGDIGLSRPESQRFEASASGTSSKRISEERISEMDGDVIFVGSVSEEALRRLRNNPLWQNLNAVREDSVLNVSQEAWIFPGPAASDSVLDDIQKALELRT